MTPLIGIRDSPLDPNEVERAVAEDDAGAIVTFVGRVRNHNAGMVVTRLEYEAYPTMATKEMQSIVQGLERRFPGTRLAVLHRIGTLNVGDAAVVCSASAAHRDEAFEACRALIDEIKATVPIWKREHGPDGPYWVGWEDARCTHPHAHTHEHAHVHEHAHSHDSSAAAPLAGWRIAAITVSDTRSLENDGSGTLIEQMLSLSGAMMERHLVRDDASAIAELVESVTATNPEAVVLSGGTGIGPRDVTCEAIRPLLDRELEGFGETFRRLSFEAIGTRALLSRAIAGVRGKCLVFAVPGSPKAVELAIEKLIRPLLPHARAMLLGGGH